MQPGWRAYPYFLVMISAMMIIHFWRFPHLVMEHGGGAFLIIYLICLFALGLPVYLAELSLGRIVGPRLAPQFQTVPKESKRRYFFLPFLAIKKVIQKFILFAFFQFFLFIACLSIFHLATLFIRQSGYIELPSVLQASLGLRFGCTFSVLLILWIAAQTFCRQTIERLSRWVLPFCFAIFVLVFYRILSVGNHFEGVKTLFYPDFSLLSAGSLLAAVGHAFVSLFLGIGWQVAVAPKVKPNPPVELGVQVTSLSALISIFAGLLAVPMVEQIHETAFGANWLFFILPRWLRYTHYGVYYCGLWFAALFIVSLLLCHQLTLHYVTSSFDRYGLRRPSIFLSLNFLLSVALVSFFYQENTWGLWGEDVILGLDRLFVEVLVPINILLVIVFLFLLTRRSQREAIILEQKTFFRAESFYRIWVIACRLVIPLALVVGWLVALSEFGSGKV